MASSTDWLSQPTRNITSGQQSQSAGSLLGQTPSYYSAEYGGIAATADPTASAAAATAGNLANSGAVSNLANYWNTFNQQQLVNQQNQVNPLYSASMQQGGQNAYDYLQGIIPQDVINQIGQQAAERGISTGLGAGSQNVSAALLRALGLTSLDLQQTGLNDLTTLYKDTPQAGLFDTTPYMTTGADFQAAQTAANKSAAAAIPYYVAQSNLASTKAGTTAGAAAAGGTPALKTSGGGNVTAAGSPAYNWTSPGGDWWNSAAAGSGGSMGGTAGNTNSVQDWWNQNYGPQNYAGQSGGGAYTGAIGSSGGGAGQLDSGQKQQLVDMGYTDQDIQNMSSTDLSDILGADYGSNYQATGPEGDTTSPYDYSAYA